MFSIETLLPVCDIMFNWNDIPLYFGQTRARLSSLGQD